MATLQDKVTATYSLIYKARLKKIGFLVEVDRINKNGMSRAGAEYYSPFD